MSERGRQFTSGGLWVTGGMTGVGKRLYGVAQHRVKLLHGVTLVME